MQDLSPLVLVGVGSQALQALRLEGHLMEVGVVCGQCGGEVYMLACPDHHWAVGSICHGCQLAGPVGDGTCKECDWPKAAA